MCQYNVIMNCPSRRVVVLFTDDDGTYFIGVSYNIIILSVGESQKLPHCLKEREVCGFPETEFEVPCCLGLLCRTPIVKPDSIVRQCYPQEDYYYTHKTTPNPFPLPITGEKRYNELVRKALLQWVVAMASAPASPSPVQENSK